jgi:hypothetical protein
MAMGHSRQAFDFDKYRHSRQATQVFFYALEHVPPTVRTIQQKWAYSSAWESKKDVPTFYGEIKPVMIILRILGVLPYSTTATGNNKQYVIVGNFLDVNPKVTASLFNILKGIA